MTQDHELDEQARAILRANDRGGYTVPTRGLYPFQWNWDSCLVALGWATFDEARAWAEIETLFAAQWPDGMVPHIVFHRDDEGYFPGPAVWGTGRTPPTSGITQPPVAASCVRRLVEGARDTGLARDAARRLLPRLFAYSRWLRTARDPRGLGLVAVLHPWETGMDNSPAWDEALARVAVASDLAPYERRDTSHVDAAQRPTQAEYDRYLTLVQTFRRHGWDPAALHDVSPFRVADVGINALRLRAERDLAWLAGALGEPGLRAEAEAVAAQAERGFTRLWHEGDGCYRSRDLVADTLVPVSTSAGFLAFAAGGQPPGRAARLGQTFDRWLGTVAYGLPSLPADAPAFDRRRYWRGPVWAIVNFMVAEGLAAQGMADRAARLKADTGRLIRGAGFAEYFDPLDGSGLGGGAFSWTAAMWLAWAGRGGT